MKSAQLPLTSPLNEARRGLNYPSAHFDPSFTGKICIRLLRVELRGERGFWPRYLLWNLCARGRRWRRAVARTVPAPPALVQRPGAGAATAPADEDVTARTAIGTQGSRVSGSAVLLVYRKDMRLMNGSLQSYTGLICSNSGCVHTSDMDDMSEGVGLVLRREA